MGRPGPEGPDAVVVRPAGAGVSLPPACGQGGGMMKKPPVLCHLVLFLVFFFSEKCAVALFFFRKMCCCAEFSSVFIFVKDEWQHIL